MDQQLGGRTVICVDIGMTGSIALWKHSKFLPQWDNVDSTQKIPTQLMYSNVAGEGTRTPISWGKGCGHESLDKVEGFKIFFGRPDLEWPAEIGLGMPPSETELYKWTQDYLRCFCQYTVARIDAHIPRYVNWRENEVDWSFTVPGSWGVSTVRGFHRLIEEVLHPLFRNSHGLRIHTKVTEAEASVMAMVFDGIGINNPRYSAGKILLSCDIGGSTTDIAACQMTGTGSVSVIYQSLESPSGVVLVQKELWLHVWKILKRAGVQNAEEVAWRIFRRESGETLNLRLMKEEDIFEFQTTTEMADWSASDETTTIKRNTLLITRQTIAGFFTPFAEEVEKAISRAQEELELHEVTVDAVGICGGGSLASYCIRAISKRISTAGKSNILVVGPQDLTFKADLATVVGNCIIWDQEELSKLAQNTIFGIEKDACIYWKLAEQDATPSGSKYLIGWTVSFDLSTRSRSETHRLVAISKTSEAPPNTFEMASHSSGFRSWQIQATLSNSTIPGLQSKRNYQICCQVVQDLNVVITCQDRESGKILGCKVQETTEVGGPKKL